MAQYINKDEAYRIVLHYGSYAASAKIADLKGIELVRCKDCKYWTSNTQYCKLYSIGAMANRTPANWYCMGGERKDAE